MSDRSGLLSLLRSRTVLPTPLSIGLSRTSKRSISSFPETWRNLSKKTRGEIEGNMESDQEKTCPLLLESSTGGTSSSKEKAADLVDRRALANGTHDFARFFATSSVGEEADKFAAAAADFSVAEDEHAKKTAAAALSASATALSDAVHRAGEVDSALASRALRLLGDARKLLPQDDDDDDSQAGRCFPAFLARLFRRSKTPPTLIQGTEDDLYTPEEKQDAEALLKNAIQFADAHSASRSSLAAPATDLASTLQSFLAAADDVSKTSTAAKLEEAALALAAATSNEKVAQEASNYAKKLALQTARLVSAADKEPETACWSLLSPFSCFCSAPQPGRRCCWFCEVEEPRLPLHERDVERQKVLMDKRSALYCLSMPASLALVPTLKNVVPKDQHTVVAFIYGCIFSSATVGLVLSLHALDRIDLKIARFLSRLSVVGLAVLVVFYVSCDLAPGNSLMLWFFMVVVFCGHAYAWLRSTNPSQLPAEQPDGGD